MAHLVAASAMSNDPTKSTFGGREGGKAITAIDRMEHAMDWCVAELNNIHEALNALEIPREHDGQKLSVAQRVDILVGAYKSACGRIGRDAP